MTEEALEPVRRLYVQLDDEGRPARWSSSPLGDGDLEMDPVSNPREFYHNGEAWLPVPAGEGPGKRLDPVTGEWTLDAFSDEFLAAINAERDRRINGGFTFGGVVYQTRPEDRENMAGAATSALAAITDGAQQGDLRWHGGSSDFAWIAQDNTLVPMDAQTMLAFGQAAMAHKQAHIFAARALKDMPDAPSDITDDALWPA
ncbi:DUF4376 domain-containing protein [Salipiger sp. PrR003]|uniref:DUF4376 domain-containing protein n=1 Tax=Salipiger sp. PrR003 TaxID=2706776 RepID=UPI0013DBB2C8|nr:DUF4376 domain-containing protein [Salipiger sp. PrR003]NDV48696.1 DUF4376 domain-containing protein [Salipiger sp. PrR003]